jgi:hypothetical protein
MFRKKTQLHCPPEIVSPSPLGETSPLPGVSGEEKGKRGDKDEPPERLTVQDAETAWLSQQGEASIKSLKTTGMKILYRSSLRRARLWLKSCSTALMFPKPPQGDAKGQQRQKLREMGTYLQEVRRKAGLSLETVASITLIPLRLLRAIEAGDLDALPEPIYIRGFLKQFADALGLPGGEFARSFPTTSEIKAAQKRRRVFSLPSLQLRPLHLYFLYLVLVALSVQGISYALKQQIQEMSAPPTPLLPSPPTVAPSQPAKKSVPPSPIAGPD